MAYSPMMQKILVSLLFLSLGGCAAATDTYRDQHMDFGSVQTIAVLPFVNLSHEGVAAERVKDVFTNMLLASGSIYVLPPGEVNRGVNLVGIASPSNPSKDEIIRFASAVKADAVITGVVREYGELRSGTTVANVLSMSVQLTEAQGGRVVWAASTTTGGISIWDRLFGGGGEPMNDITEKAVNDVLNKLFK